MTILRTLNSILLKCVLFTLYHYHCADYKLNRVKYRVYVQSKQKILGEAATQLH